MKRKFSHFLVTAVLLAAFFLPGQSPARGEAAQAPSNPWQTTATGLQVSAQNQYRTSGLGFTVQAQGWPVISAYGGVVSVRTQVARASSGIQLGAIKPTTGTAATLTAQSADWSTNRLDFSGGGQSLTLWASRLSPALLVQSAQGKLRFFTGSHPKYAAFAKSNGVQIVPLNASTSNLGMTDYWLLVWYGSAFSDSKKPLSFSGFDSPSPNSNNSLVDSYPADIPVLFRFQNLPISIGPSSEGGIELAFSGSAGSIALLPLYGRNNPPASVTDAWAASGPPTSVTDQIRWWTAHLASYPTAVSETYGYDLPSDTASIQEQVSFTQLVPGGTLYAPVPPMLALAASALSVNFSAPLVDSGLKTEFGPYLGVENQTTYTWSVQGLLPYTNDTRAAGGSAPPSYLMDDLNNQVASLIQGGHYAPWIYADHFPKLDIQGDIYWNNPADLLYAGTEIADALAEPQKSQLISYLRSERYAYPPETVANIPLTSGTIRGPFSVSGAEYTNRWVVNRPDVFESRVHLYNFYSLARYYRLTMDSIPSTVLTLASQVLDQDMREQDWATFYWFNGFQDRLYPTVNANRHFAGLVGAVRLFMYSGSAAQEAQARALLAKSAVLSVGMAKYIPYLYASGIQQVPGAPSWQILYTAGNWSGFIFNYSWTGAGDDHRSIRVLDQFGMRLEDDSQLYEDWYARINAHLTAYFDLTPELGRMLSDHAPESYILAQKVSALYPVWYTAFDSAALGVEHDYNHPGDTYQIFLARDWMGSATPAQLEQYTDIPWLSRGDLFYIHKVAEAVKAYRGFAWQRDNYILLTGQGTNQTLSLKWNTSARPGASDSWTIIYNGPGPGPGGSPPSPVTGIDGALRQYILTGLQNYYKYAVQVSFVQNGGVVASSNTLTLFPTDIFIHLPLIGR